MAKQRKSVSVEYVSASLLPGAMTCALESIREKNENASMELVELQQRKVEALVAAELLRQLLQRIRERLYNITSRQLADASVQSAFTSTSYKIVNERKAAILLRHSKQRS